MAHITVDGDMVRELTVDGDQCDEINIDGCSIRFIETYRTGWFSITDGSGNRTIDMTEAQGIWLAGIRLRGATARMSLQNVAGPTEPIGVSAGGLVSGTVQMPSVPTSAPYGCANLSAEYVRGRANASLVEAYTEMPRASTWVAGFGPHTDYVPFSQTGPNLSPGSITISGRSTTADGQGNYDRVGISGRVTTYYYRQCVSAGAPATATVGGVTHNHYFVLNPGELYPSGSGGGAFQIDDGTGHWFWVLLGIQPGIVNTVYFSNIVGSRQVRYEIFVQWYG